MNAIVSSVNGLGEAWWAYALHATWQSAVLGLLVLAAVALLRRRSAPLRYALLLVALVKFAVPPMLALPTGVFSVAAGNVPANWVYEEPAVAVPETPIEASERSAPAVSVPALASAPSAAPAPVPSIAPQPVAVFLSWKACLMLLHAVGAFILGLAVLRACLQLRRHVRTAREVRSGDLFDAWTRIRARMNVRSNVSLRVSEAADAPLAFGVARPTVLLPLALSSRLPEPQLEAVLAHELAHVRRRDAWVIWTENVLLMAWWFNPVLWIVIRVLRRSREQCCDDAVLAARIADGHTYCSSLVNAATHAVRGSRLNAALGMADGFHPMAERIRRIMDATLRRSPKLSLAGILVVGLVAMLALPGLHVAKAQEQVPPSPAPEIAQQAPAAPAPTTEPPKTSPAADPQEAIVAADELTAKTETEIREHYASADADVQEYIRWTAQTFRRGDLWLAEDAFASLSPEEREQKITHAVEVLNGEYGRHQCRALAEAGALKDPRLLPGLIKVASYHRDDSDYDCRPKWMGVAALGRQEDITAVPTLVPLVDHGNTNVRMWARASLVRLTGQNFSADKQAWGKWWNESGHQPAIDLAQLKPWTPPASLAPPQEAEQAVPQPLTVPDAVKAAVDGVAGTLLFQGQYVHKSRGHYLPQPAVAWIKRINEEQTVAAVYMPSMEGTTFAYYAPRTGLYRYETLYHREDGDGPQRTVMEISPGLLKMTYTGGEKNGQTVNFRTPEGVFLPNTRPDPYAGALPTFFGTLPKDTYEIEGYDWDNSGKQFAGYKTQYEYKGEEPVTVPAGTFKAHHYVETQLTSGDTWYKKRAGHVTEYWVLNNGVVLRILRHREPYEVLLLSADTAEMLPESARLAAPAPAAPVATEPSAGGGLLGVEVEAVGDRWAEYKLPSASGARVKQVLEGSPGAQAGIQSGDIVRSLNGLPVQGPNELAQIIRAVPPGTQVELEVWRDGSARKVAVTLGSPPASSR